MFRSIKLFPKRNSRFRAIKPGVLLTEPWLLPGSYLPPSRYKRARYTKLSDLSYVRLSLLFLVASTVYWAWFGAGMHMTNADQLVDPLLFQSLDTFRDASFPATHTFLLKWPLFAAVAALGMGETTIVIATVILCLLTVLPLAWVVRKIIKDLRLYAFFIAVLSCVLLVLPAVPYPGALLPINFAMLTTRNIEYVIFAVGLALILRSSKIVGLRMFAGIALLALLFASDRMFVPLSAGAGLFVLLAGVAYRSQTVRRSGGKLLTGLLLATILALGILHAISTSGITNIIDETVGSPFGLATPRSMVIGALYGVLHTTTLLGLNVANDEPTLTNLPAAIGGSFTRPWALTSAMLVAVFAMFARVLQKNVHKVFRRQIYPTTTYLLSLALIGATGTAFVQFVVTDHYYAADARYLLIALPTVTLLAATLLKDIQWSSIGKKMRLSLTGLLVVAAVASLSYAPTSAKQHNAVIEPITLRNEQIAQYMRANPELRLVGDYWRVIPIKASDSAIQITPLAGCTTVRNSLTTNQWDIGDNAVAYLLSYDRSLTDYPACSKAEIQKNYGLPLRVDVVNGTVENPLDVLMIYPKLVKSSVAKTVANQQDCSVGKTMAIVAHQDDDILFMNPDIMQQVRVGRCIRTVYLTAGDNGQGSAYWIDRQRGSERAYGVLTGAASVDWIRSVASPDDVHTLPTSRPGDNARVGLYFVGVPDGGVYGDGFENTKQQSLRRLLDGAVTSLADLSDNEEYTRGSLNQLLVSILKNERPDQLLLLSNPSEYNFQDHSDHVASGEIAMRAARDYISETGATLRTIGYTGYPVFHQEPNVSDEALTTKIDAFLEYSKLDSATCPDREACLGDPAYGSYLTRQYGYDILQ